MGACTDNPRSAQSFCGSEAVHAATRAGKEAQGTRAAAGGGDGCARAKAAGRGRGGSWGAEGQEGEWSAEEEQEDGDQDTVVGRWSSSVVLGVCASPINYQH